MREEIPAIKQFPLFRFVARGVSYPFSSREEIGDGSEAAVCAVFRTRPAQETFLSVIYPKCRLSMATLFYGLTAILRKVVGINH